MKSFLPLLFASAAMAVAQTPGSINQDDNVSSAFAPTIPEDPIAYFAGLREALSDRHEKGSAVKGYLQTVCKLSNEDAVLALKYLVDNLADGESFQDKNDRFQAICCIRDYPCEEAYAFLERLLTDINEPERRTAAYSLARLSLSNPDCLTRLQAIADVIPTENWARQEVYRTISTHLQYEAPPSSQQVPLIRFLLERASVDTQLFDMLDEILCREVPKWRASPQRAENAAKMILEHPDDARLVAFFETVRTNALEAARATVPTERRDSASPPVSTNRVSEAGAPAAPNGNAAVSDPWAGLLDDLPEKKPWTPPPGYEPPF